jgi:hypothetical protein
VSAVLGPEGAIEGKVTDVAGEPLENICVEASDEHGPAGIVAHTDSEGQYSLNALVGGSYKLKFSDCQDTNEAIVTPEYYDDKATLEEAVPVVVSNGGLRSAIDAQLATEPRPVPTEFKARIGKLGVKGPLRVKKGHRVTFRVRITNFGNAEAKGVKVKGSGRGVRFKASVGKIAPKKTRTIKVKVKPKKAGRAKITFKVTSSNAGGSAVKHGITVRK